MKKSFLLIMCAVALVLGFSSCGGNSTNDSTSESTTEEQNEEELSKTIPASSVTIKGEYKDLIKVDGDVKIILTKANYPGRWQIKAVIPTSNTKPWSEIAKTRFDSKDVSAYLKFKYLDANESEMDMGSLGGFKSCNLIDLLKSEEITTEKMTIQYFSSTDGDEYKVAKEKFDKVNGAKIEVSISIYDEDDFSNEDDEEDDDSSDDSSSTTTDWDAILDELENYVDKTITVCNKVNNGDMSAMSEYSSLIQSSQELSSKLAQGQGSMTAAQVARYTKISTKMANAALKMK